MTTFLVTGSRDFANEFVASLFIDQCIRDNVPPYSIVLHGNARGADQIAGASAVRHDSAVRIFEADWEQHGKRAGILRNLEMLDEKPDVVLAFWNGTSKGTKHTIEEAQRRGIPVKIWRIP